MSEAERQRESEAEGEAIGLEQTVEGVGCCLAEAATGCLGVLLALATLVAVAVFAVGCDQGESALPGHIVNWEGPVYPIPESPSVYRTSEFDGWEHCGWQKARFLQVPAVDIPGRDGATEQVRRQYALNFVRDSAGVIRANIVGPLDLKASLPADAVRAPYTQKGREIWFSPSELATGVYVVDGEKVERWPRFDGGCD